MSSEDVNSLILSEVGRTDDQILDTTQALRLSIINSLTEGGKRVPDDLKIIYAIKDVALDMDRAVLAKKKIAADVNKGNADRESALIMARILGKTSLVNNPLRSNVEVVDALEHDDSLLPHVVPFAGETELGISGETYNDFVARVEKDK